MKQNAQMTLRERTPTHSQLDKAFPRTPPETPRKGLKRTFSNNMKTAFANVLPMTPPSTPPTRFGIHSTLARTMSDTVNKQHQISIFALKNRPTIVTIDVTDSSPSRRTSLRRSSSYSMDSAGSGSRDPLDRVRDYSARSTDSRYPSESPTAPPAYSPPPNTPANAYTPGVYTTTTGVQIHGITQRGAGAQGNDPFNPFSYTGPTQYPNHSLQRAPTQPSNGLWQGNGNYGAQFPHLPSPSAFQTPNASVVDLEKARRSAISDHPKKNRGCKKAVICCIVLGVLLVLVVVAAVIIIVRLRHHFHNKYHHHKRMNCITVPGMYVNGHWNHGYEKCT